MCPCCCSSRARPDDSLPASPSCSRLPDGSTATVNKREDSSSQQVGDGDSQHWETFGYSIPCLAVDIWCHIHSLIPMRDAACISRTFLRSWRCHPNLTLNWTMLRREACAEELRWSIDSILRNHSGIGLKTLELNLGGQDRTFPYVDSWLQIAVTPGIEKLNLMLYKKYNFPCSLLSDGVRNSIRDLQLYSCVFRPTSELGPLRRLPSLDLSSVRITGGELECLLSNSLLWSSWSSIIARRSFS